MKTLLILQFLAFLALLTVCLLRHRETGRSALYRLALNVSAGIRWCAAFIMAVATVVDELHLWKRIEVELRFQLAQDSFEVAGEVRDEFLS